MHAISMQDCDIPSTPSSAFPGPAYNACSFSIPSTSEVSLPPSPTLTHSSTDLQEVEHLVQLNSDDDDQLQTGTPLEASLEDEPSTVLANRIMRAHDNPSPPPSPSTPTPFSVTHLLANDDFAHDPRHIDFLTEFDTNETAQGISSSNESSTPPSTGYTSPRETSHNPISFDPDSLPSAFKTSIANVEDLTSTSKHTVDELPFGSPPRLVPNEKGLPHLNELVHTPSTTQAQIASVETNSGSPLECDASSPQLYCNTAAAPSTSPVSSCDEVTENTQYFTAFDSGLNDSATQSRVEKSGAPPSSVIDIQAAYTPVASRIQTRPRSPTRLPQPFSRELGSLSPTSTGLLEQLVPPVGNAEAAQGSSLPLFAPPTRHPGSNFASPVRKSTSSPVKLAPPPLSPQKNEAHFPARRIPLDEAVAQGHVSPQKALQLGRDTNSVGLGIARTPLFVIPKVDSPARRVLLTESSSSSPSRKQNGLTVDPISLRRIGQGSGKSTGLQAPAKLPFPLVPPMKDLSADKDATKDKKLVVASSPVKSNLKQPTSRIPRIGVKPYLRPVGVVKPSEKLNVVSPSKPSTLPTIAGASTASTARISVAKLSGTTKASGEKPNAITRPGSSAIRNSVPYAESLKRKRGPETSPPSMRTRPATTIRRVAKTAEPKAPVVKATSSRTAVTKRAPPSGATPVAHETGQKSGVLHIRRVIDRKPPAVVPPLTDIGQPVVEPLSDHPAVPHEPLPKPETDLDPLPTTSALQNPVVSPPSPVSPDAPATSQTEEQPSVTQTSEDSPQQQVRRTNRVRKPVKPLEPNDAHKDSNVRPVQRRKATSQSATHDDVFFGMSVNALKALTTSNTNRNQQYVAAKLETEVIKKQGARPESPVVKVRTIIQKQQDDKGKSRKERAERRAKRLGGDQMDENEVDWIADADSSGYSSSASRSLGVDEGSSESSAQRHRRGAGDDEDYESPDKSGQRAQLDGKRVKWDKGLFTTVYLDEVKVGSRKPQKENIQAKGCLAPAARAIRLDNLGNHPNAESPVPELVEEHIVIKKFVYEDEEPVEEVVVVRNTRSRTKKKS